MLNSMMDNYLETLESYIKDEDKLVTYKWLSKELEVHTNVAKQVLEMYWKKHNKEESLTATILLIGYTHEGEMRVEVVREENLEEAIKKYNKIISQHVYSLQKVLPDIELLANVGGGDAKYGAIKCTKSSLLSDEELFNRRWGSRAQFDIANKEPERARNNDTNVYNKNKNTLFGHMKPASSSTSGGDVATKNKPEVKEKNDGSKEKTPPKKLSPQKNKFGDKKTGATKKPVQSGAAGFKSLFKNVAATNEKKMATAKEGSSSKINGTEVKKIEEDEPMDTQEVKKPSNGVVEKIESQKSTSSKDSQASLKSEKDNKSGIQNGKEMQRSKSKKRQRSQEKDKNNGKKRKRIITAVDSSDESAGGSDTDRDLFDDCPPIEEPVKTKAKSPSPPRIQNINGKRKVRKAVDKTFQDEDGFLVTKKVYVYESASDDESPPVKVEAPKEVKKISPESSNKAKKLNKQTTLMSFFKKA